MKRIIALMAMVACGLGLYLYPQAIQWQQMREDLRANADLDQTISRQTPVAQNAMLEAAKEYNERLGHQPTEIYDAVAAAADTDYQSQLRDPNSAASLADTGADSGELTAAQPLEAMGRVNIPRIDVSLPIYHGTSEEALARGAGHIYGTSLPVGGEGTHTVITAHSRQGQAGRFTRIRELEVGDEFFLTAAGQTIRYVVDQITTVLPSEVENLQIIPGEDHATLLTCTPLGLNTHRLLVRGVREDLPAAAGTPLPTGQLPFPWWAVWFGVGVALTGAAGWGINKALLPKSATAGTGAAGAVASSAVRSKGSTRPAAKAASKPAAKPGTRPAVKTAAKPATKLTPKPVAKAAPKAQTESAPRSRQVAQKGAAR